MKYVRLREINDADDEEEVEEDALTSSSKCRPVRQSSVVLVVVVVVVVENYRSIGFTPPLEVVQVQASTSELGCASCVRRNAISVCKVLMSHVVTLLQ